MNTSKNHRQHKSGFKKYLSVKRALRIFLEFYKRSTDRSYPVDDVNLPSALNRVLAKDLSSPVDVPLFNRSAMDGYALLSEDTKGASARYPVSLRLIGKLNAGENNQYSIRSGQCVSVATGARIPEGANAVVMVEHTSTKRLDKMVRILREIDYGKNVSLKGEDIKKHQIFLRKGTWLNPQDIAIIASVGILKIQVCRRPRVAVFATGNELVEPGSQLGSQSKLFESNGYMLSCMVNSLGGEAVNLGICKDAKAEIITKLKQSLRYDIVVVSGGSSVGDLDFVPGIVRKIGSPGLLVHGIAMRPGSPTGLGLINGVPIILVPGFPVSAFFAFYTFGKPLLEDILGTSGTPETKIIAKMAKGIKLHDDMRTFIRVRITAKRKMNKMLYYLAEPISAAGASLLSTLAQSDGVVITDNKKWLKKGERVEVTLLRSTHLMQV